MPTIPIPEDPLEHFHDTASAFTVALAELVAIRPDDPQLMPRTSAFIEAVNDFGKACVMLAVWMQPTRP